MRLFGLRFWAAALGVLSASAVFAQVTASPQARVFETANHRALQAVPSLKYMPYTVIVRFAPGASRASRNETAALADAVFVKELMPSLNIELLGTLDPRGTVARLQGMPGVRYAELDYVVHASVIPNDTSFGTLWGMHNTGQSGGVVDADIDAPEAWDSFTGDPSFVVADIDTGVDYNHPDLAANCWVNPNETVNGVDDDGNGFIDDLRGWDFVNNDNNPMDDNNHGTHTSGTFGAVGNNSLGVTGVNWQCKIMALKFLSASGSGSTAGAISCVNYAVQKGVKVSNNSWGGGGFSQALYDAINSGKSVGHIFVAAAGNSGLNNDTSPHYPSSYNLDNIISVASIDRFDARSSFSNYGATSVDLAAPGSSILSTVVGTGYSTFNGTSMATPHVCGVVMLVYALHPTWTYGQVRDQVFGTVRPTAAMSGITATGGVVNAAAAVGGVSNTPPTVDITTPTNGAFFPQGTSVNFGGSASDNQDGNLTASLVWTSSLQGQIGTGGTFSRSDLSVGTHLITASVTDSGSLSGSDSVTITITSTGGVPAAPSNLVVTRIANDRARLTWVDNSNNETAFDIERQTRVGNTWTNTASFSVGANVTLFENTAGDGRFRYRVRASNANGSSAYTGWITVRL